MKDPLIGKQFANFRIERVLGHGGMAQVYYGRDIKLKRPVAIKVIKPNSRDSSSSAKRFLNEGRLMANWRHENIIQVYYADDVNGLYYYVMEYIDGQDLGSILATYADQNKMMPVKDVLRIGRATANALDYAHHHGAIHRDVKPSNVLISESGRVVLCDFGLALETQEVSLGEIFGTPHYISPEQAKRSADAVPQSDLYSLGVILYEMLTGAVPFDDPSPASVALQHIIQMPPPPRSINPKLPQEAEKVLLKALEKDPHNRYKTGAELMDALEKALASPASSRAKVVPLPPPPVGTQPANRPANKKSPASRVKLKKENRPRRSSLVWWILGLLCLGGFFFAWSHLTNRSNFMPFGLFPAPTATATAKRATPKVAAIPTDTNTPTADPVPSQLPAITLTPSASPSPYPSAAGTLANGTANVTDTPTFAQATATAALTEPATALYPTSLPAPTAKPLALNHFVLYYDNNSFYIYSDSRASRTLSAFSFQRLDNQGAPASDSFAGWLWTEYYPPDILPYKGCAALEVYESPPYLDPPKCVLYVSILGPARNSGKVFWTVRSDSDQFLVLWKGQAVAHCQILNNVCDVYIP